MLSIVATPVGNLADLAPRGLEALRRASLIACEDTRRTWALLSALEIPRPRMISYRQGNEERVAEQIARAVAAGDQVVLCSDGGYPGISDPGYRLIRLAVQEGLPFTVIPGASAVELALLHSGLSTASFTFKGFPPRRPGALLRFFEEERDMPHTLVCFESPFRIAATLKAAFAAFGDRQAAACIELTKLHERVHRAFLSDLIEIFDNKKIKGEVTLVFAGSNLKFAREAAAPSPGEKPARRESV